MSEPIRYNFTNLLAIVDDVEKRTLFYKKMTSFLQKKAEIDYNYAHSIDTLIAKDPIPNGPSNLASQILYQKLVAVVQEEPKRIKLMAEKIMESANTLNELADVANAKSKKSLQEAQKMGKDILHLKQKLQKLKPRIQRKLSELQQVKTEYLSSMLGNEQLQKKNDLYLEVGRMEYALKPIQEEYKTYYSKYNESINQMGSRFCLHLQANEELELKKIANLKAIVANYVYLTKLNLDSFLERYPFVRQEIDTVRLKEEFIRHSRESLMVQAQDLNEFIMKETDYIDVIFDRIEKKKNLEELILYGQNVEHKKNLNSVAELNNAISPVLPKTSRMVTLFKAIFEEESSQDMIYEMETLFRGDEKLRKDFIFCLQKYRISNEFELKLNNKQPINLCLCSFLDACANELDTYNSKMLMLLSVTYHFKDQDRKIELQELIKDHRIWKNIGWWQSALFETIYEETRVKVKKEEATINIWDIKAGGSSRKQEGEELTNQHICFNQLLYFVSNMHMFSITPENIWNYAKKNNQLFKLPQKLARSILKMCPEQGSPLSKIKPSSPSNISP